MLYFENQIPNNKAEFISLVLSVSQYLRIDPNWLMMVMYFESRLNPQAVNSVSGATGLIQFMPSTARNLGTTTDALKQMSNVEQMQYVKKYFEPYRGKMHNFTDVYFAVFYPVAMNKPRSYVLGSQNLKASVIADQNAGFDLDKDRQITRGEVEDYLSAFFKKKISMLAR